MGITKKTEHKFTNKEIAGILKEALAAMEIKGFNIFRIRAYQNAISTIESITSSVYDLWQNNRLDEIPGMGVALKSHMDDLFTTGKVQEFVELKKDLPKGMFPLIGIKGIGAKTAFKLATSFKLNDPDIAIDKVKEACMKNKVRDLPGFAEKKERDILKAIEQVKMAKNEMPRLLITQAEDIARRVIQYLKQDPSVIDALALGSLRRRSSTVGDLDIAISTNNPSLALSLFLKFPEIEEITGEGEKKASVRLKSGTQVDVRVSDPESFGSMVQYFTGSKLHNVALRTYALSLGLSLSEYGIKSDGSLTKYSDEESFYKALGLSYIEPELRQGRDEVDLASKNKLPDLIKAADLKGDVHVHSNHSDGINTIEEMVLSAVESGYSYIGISDHSPSLQTRGKYEVLGIIEGIRNKIDNINSSQRDIRVYFGYEVNILADGTLSLSDDVLSKLDYVVASIHTSFDQPRDVVTKRLNQAIEHPLVTIIGHPSGRLINTREPMDIDWDSFLSAAERNNKIIEINSQPERLDLPDDLVYTAVKRGIKFSISSDAHSSKDLSLARYGIDVARRAGLSKKDVINTLELSDFERLVVRV